ncbi:MAG: SurA N-terminal domain-containing protein [Chthonomonas sp.]|nr:SurA N-terminal domain-containing protein [Chthonomonas sp.]
MKVKTLKYLPILAALAVGLTGCGKSGPAASKGDTLAIVNGEKISLDEYLRYMENKPQMRVVTGDGQVAAAQVADTVGFQSLQDLIQQKLVLQMAKDEGVLPTEDDLIKEIEFQKKLRSTFMSDMTRIGLTVDDIRVRLKVDLARERLLTKNITVKPEEIDQYIKDNPQAFTTPAMAETLYIFARNEDRRAVVEKELARGQAFATVAAQYSQNQSPDGSNVYQERVIERMPVQFRAAIVKAAVSTQTDWIRMDDGFVKFYVRNKTEAKKETIDDTKKESVRRQLAIQKGMQAREIDKTLLNKFKEAKIDVKYDPLKALYGDFDKKLKETKSGATGS